MNKDSKKKVRDGERMKLVRKKRTKMREKEKGMEEREVLIYMEKEWQKSEGERVRRKKDQG